jgi:hypothetical protein
MLQKLADEIAECYRHARECHERAKQSHDPATKGDLFNSRHAVRAGRDVNLWRTVVGRGLGNPQGVAWVRAPLWQHREW